MTILLDTSEFLWLVSGDPRLSIEVATAIQSPANDVFLSAVSFWEICVKHAIRKLVLPEPPEIYVPRERQRHGIDPLNLDELAVAKLPGLPALHKDPFDRMLVCQAQAYNMALASTDPFIRKYPVTIL